MHTSTLLPTCTVMYTDVVTALKTIIIIKYSNCIYTHTCLYTAVHVGRSVGVCIYGCDQILNKLAKLLHKA